MQYQQYHCVLVSAAEGLTFFIQNSFIKFYRAPHNPVSVGNSLCLERNFVKLVLRSWRSFCFNSVRPVYVELFYSFKKGQNVAYSLCRRFPIIASWSGLLLGRKLSRWFWPKHTKYEVSLVGTLKRNRVRSRSWRAKRFIKIRVRLNRLYVMDATSCSS